MDATYRSELRELNDQNFAKFAALLEQRIAEVKAEFHTEIGELRGDIATLRADLIKWMFLFWAGTALTVVGLLRF